MKISHLDMPKRPVSVTHGAMDDMPKGMMRRGGAYSLRRRIPVDLIDAYGGRKEIVRALGTNDYGEAKRLHARMWVALDDEFQRYRSGLVAGEAVPVRPRPAEESWTQEQFEYEMESIGFFERQSLEYEWRQEERDRVERALAQDQDKLNAEQMAVRDLIRDAKADQKHAEQLLLLSRTPFSPEHQTPNDVNSTVDVDASCTFADLIDQWAKERGVSAKGVADHKSVVRWFEERVGKIGLANIEKRHVIDFKNGLVDSGQTSANIKVKLSRLRTVFSYAVSNAIIQANPAEGVTVLVKAGDGKSRLPFKADTLKLLFDGTVHTAGARPAGGKGEAAYWLPLLALYTGARLEELGQLSLIDLIDETYPTEGEAFANAKFIHIRSDARDGLKVKNAGSVRKVPVHSDLIRSGFLQFAEHQRALGQERLFSDLKPNKYGKLTAKWGEWFSGYRKECGVSHKGLVFHSFRHTFKHWARHVGIIEGVQRQIMGHSAKDVADGYGDGYSLHQIVEGMRLYRIPGFTPPIHPEFGQSATEV